MENQHIAKLISPSWLSGFIGGAVAILGTVAAMVVSRFNGSELQQQIFENQANASQTTTTTASSFDTITTNLAANAFLNRLPLLLTWAAIGAVVYFFAATIARSFGEAAELRDQLGYVHTSRRTLLSQSLVHLVVRGAAVVCWFLLIQLTISVFVPYAFAAASLGARSFSLENVGYTLVSVAVLFMTVHAHTILLRLMVLRSRVFQG